MRMTLQFAFYDGNIVYVEKVARFIWLNFRWVHITIKSLIESTLYIKASNIAILNIK